MAFINILKALTPAVTLLASMALGLERPSLLVAAALALIAGGTALATAQVGAPLPALLLVDGASSLGPELAATALAAAHLVEGRSAWQASGRAGG